MKHYAKAVATLLAAISAAPEVCASEPILAVEAPVVLWSDLTTATTQAEMRAFRAHLPNGRAALLVGCDAKVLDRASNGHLVSLVFVGLDKNAVCTDQILKDFTKKYGPPEAQTVVSGSLLGAAGVILDYTHSDASFRWRAEGRRIVLVKQHGGYNLIFTVRADKYLY